MKAAVFRAPYAGSGSYLRLENVPQPVIRPGYTLLKVIACGVCRTDLHIVTGELPPLRPALIPGHQIVGKIVGGATASLPVGARVGVSWMGGTDGTCWFCLRNKENLCDLVTFTGYSVDGGYAEFALVRTDFCFRCLQVWTM